MPTMTVSVCWEQLVMDPERLSGSPGDTMPGVAEAERSAQGEPAIADLEVAMLAASPATMSAIIDERRCGTRLMALRIGSWRDRRADSRGPSGPRGEPVLQGLAAGGRASDAHEQPRPRCGRAPTGPHRVRGNGEGRPVVGGVPSDRSNPPGAGSRRDA